ncbi:MAG: NAD-dependent epimerase/dehydratase family protein [Patescibacteria group bacterium]|jgi:UDP-glucose 4-epimerase
MRIIVTGGAGFIGSHIVDRLIKDGHHVTVVDDLSTGKKANLNPKAKFYKLSVTSDKLSAVWQKVKPQAVFHLAAQMSVRHSVENPKFDASVNIVGAINVLENCRKYGTKKVIFSSTGGAMYGEAPRRFIPTRESYPPQPQSPYGIAKYSVEHYLEYYYEIFGLRYVALRFSNVYGPRQNSHGEAGVVAIFIDRLLRGKQPVINGVGVQTRDYVYVSDVVDAAMLAMKRSKIGSYNISTAKETNVNQIFNKITKALKTKIRAKHGSAKIGEQRRSCLSYDLASRDLGWKPKMRLDEGIKKTAEWFKNNNK